jgi:hypothetical protein
MKEDEVKIAALNYVNEQQMSPCEIYAIRRRSFGSLIFPGEQREEWVVEFRFTSDDDLTVPHALIIVDGLTGATTHFPTL